MTNTLKFGILSLLTTVLLGCSKEEAPVETVTSIIGNWKLIEVYDDPGDGSGSWHTVDNGYTYNFSGNGKFTSTRFQECSTGNYTIDANQLTLAFDCDGFTTGIEDPEGTFVETYHFESNTVIFTPTYLSCIEGCGWKFIKVN